MIFGTPLPLKNQYKNCITIEDARHGIVTTLNNAKELLEDATLLLNNERHPRAVALAILAIEEYGKIEKIKNLLISGQFVSKSWKEVRSHTSKNFMWQFPIIKALGINDEATIRKLTSPTSDSAKFLDQLKQICFYTEAVHLDKSSKCIWWQPSVITDKEVAEFYLDLANTIVLDDGIQWTEKSLNIFVNHHFYENGEIFIKNQLNYYKELVEMRCITKGRYQRILNNINQINDSNK